MLVLGLGVVASTFSAASRAPHDGCGGCLPGGGGGEGEMVSDGSSD